MHEKLSLQRIETDGMGLGDEVADPFDGLTTVYMQEKLYSEHLGCIVSQSHPSVQYHCIIMYLLAGCFKNQDWKFL